MLLASRLLQKPRYPYVPLRAPPEDNLNALNRTKHPLAQLGTGFQILHDLLPSDVAIPLFHILHNLSTYSLAVYDYVTGRSQAQSLASLADQRNFVQHNLMSMIPGPSDNQEYLEDDTHFLQEACWAAGSVYSLITVFPIPHYRAPFTNLACQIKQCLIDMSAHSAKSWQKPSPLLLWITFMGVLAATASDQCKEEKSWYMNVIERLLHRMQIFSWQNLKDELLNFLWFPSTSDTDGRRLWREIHDSNPWI